MKINAPRKDLILLFTPIFILLSLTFIIFFPRALIFIFHLHWIFLLGLLITVFLPWRNIQFSAAKTHPSMFKWLVDIWSLQTALFFLFWGINNLLSFSDFFPATVNNLGFGSGLFPWGIIGIFILGYQYWAYYKWQDAYPSRLLQPLIKLKPTATTSLIVNYITRLASLTALGVSTALIATLPLTYGFNLTNLILATGLLIFVFTRFFKKILNLWFSIKLPLFFQLGLLIIGLGLLLFLLSSLLSPLNTITLNPPHLFHYLQKNNNSIYWLIFSYCWWICWAPIVSLYIAKISRGYSWQAIILASLVIPAFCTMLLFNHKFFSHPHAVIASILALLGFLKILHLICEKSFLPCIIFSYLPQADTFKHRDHRVFFRNIIKMAAVVIYFYLPAGIIIINLLILIFTFPFILISMLISFTILWSLINYEKIKY